MTPRWWSKGRGQRTAAVLAAASLVFAGGVASNVLSAVIPDDWLEEHRVLVVLSTTLFGLAAALYTIRLTPVDRTPAPATQPVAATVASAAGPDHPPVGEVNASRVQRILPGEWSLDRADDPTPPVRALFAFDDKGRYRLSRVAKGGPWKLVVAYGGRETIGIWAVTDTDNRAVKLTLYAVQTKWPFLLQWIGLDQVHSQETASGEPHFVFTITDATQDRLTTDTGAFLRRLYFPNF